MSTPTIPNRIAIRLTVEEAERLLRKLRLSSFLHNHAITLTLEPHPEPFMMNDGTKLPTANIRVTAENDVSVGMGCGFVVAISEGVHKTDQ